MHWSPFIPSDIEDKAVELDAEMKHRSSSYQELSDDKSLREQDEETAQRSRSRIGLRNENEEEEEDEEKEEEEKVAFYSFCFGRVVLHSETHHCSR